MCPPVGSLAASCGPSQRRRRKQTIICVAFARIVLACGRRRVEASKRRSVTTGGCLDVRKLRREPLGGLQKNAPAAGQSTSRAQVRRALHDLRAHRSKHFLRRRKVVHRITTWPARARSSSSSSCSLPPSSVFRLPRSSLALRPTANVSREFARAQPTRPKPRPRKTMQPAKLLAALACSLLLALVDSRQESPEAAASRVLELIRDEAVWSARSLYLAPEVGARSALIGAANAPAARRPVASSARAGRRRERRAVATR